MAFDTALTTLLEIRHPILLAPMAVASGGALAAAVSDAGGLGFIGVGYADERWIEAEFQAAGSSPVGVGFITWHLLREPHRLEVALAHKPAAVIFSFGDCSPFIDAVKRAGAKVLMQVQTLAAAREAARLGADAIVAQGTEAGGHGGGRGTLPLVAAVVDAVAPIPVVAAGGIADGRGLAAALTLGAAGVLMGTRFYASTEALGHAEAKARLISGEGDATVRTTVFDRVRGYAWPTPYTGRALTNDFVRAYHGRESELDERMAEERERYAAAAAAGDLATAVVWAGENVDLIHDIAPAGEIVHRVVEQAQRAIAAAALSFHAAPSAYQDTQAD
ncbi:nitronate monooxygenase [bacterium]|nr:MAG: nitronate monooxygenase [bacterium]